MEKKEHSASEVRWAKEKCTNIIDTLENLYDEILRLRKERVDMDNAQPIQQFEKFPSLPYWDPSKYGSFQNFKNILDDAMSQAEKAHIANESIAKNNQVVFDKAVAIMKGLGFSETERYKKTRTSFKYHERQSAWLTSLSLQCPRDSNATFNKFKSSYESLLKRAKDWDDKKKLEIKAKEDAKIQQSKSLEKQRILGSIIAKYNLDISSDFDEIFDKILSKHPYLTLAYAMLQTRNDWSDGFYRVESALSIFDRKTSRDKEIYEDISDCLGEDDGRVFRDIVWNYDSLFKIVKQESPDVYSDFEIMQNLIQE